MTDMTCMRSVLAALLIVTAGAVTASAQAQLITARTPSRGTTSGGTTVEILGNSWFSFSSTIVTMGGTAPGCTGTAQPTNLVVHASSRLTFVTPARPSATVANACTITVTVGAISRTTPFTYVVRTRNSVSGARRPVFSHDGQYVAFESRYALAPTDTNGLLDIYVRNRATGALRRVSISSMGSQALGGESLRPAISANGRFVAFQSRATNLVAGDTNGLMDVFLHDRDADGNGVFDEAGGMLTERISLAQDSAAPNAIAGTQALGGDSGDPVLSGNGRYVTYTSAAINLLGPNVDTNGRLDVFSFDRQRRVTRLQSTTADGQLGNGNSRHAAMSLGGRFVAFESLASNFGGGDPNLFDIFLRDRDTDEDGVYDENLNVSTQLVSADRCGNPLNGHSIEPSITYDGNYVVFATVAANANLDPNCIVADFNGQRHIYIWDRLGDPPEPRRLSEGSGGSGLPGASGAPVISGNGSLLRFRTQVVNAGASSTAGPLVAAAGEDGKSTTGGVPSPTTDNPPPPDIPPPPPNGSAEEPSTSGDGNTTGNTTEPDPGTGQGEPVVELDETPPDANGTPFIAGLSPGSGPTDGGALVDIHGANFVSGQTTVQWNNTTLAPASVAFMSSSLLRVTTPEGPFDGPVPVRVISADEASNEAQYMYVANLTAPSITTFAPNTATTAGGGSMTITGNDFTAGAVSVRFGPTAAVVAPGSTANSITVTIPPAAVAGPVPIVVQNSNGTTAVSNSPFTYTFVPPNAAPSIQPLTPNSGPVTGGTSITISGSNFAPGSTVTVGGVPATDVQVMGSTQIVAVAPPGVEGSADVVVNNGIAASPAQTFVYEPLAAPILACTGTDSDSDGAPDLWELQYGLNAIDGTDGGLDSDSDLLTNAQECAALTHPRGFYRRYLAEGATGSFFDTRVVVANPGVTAARVLFLFQKGTGEVVRHYVVVPAQSRRTVDVRLLAGLLSANLSTVIESDVQIVVDRTMRWDQTTRSGAHAESSAPAPSLTWYLAEGATHGAFDLFYLIQNPSQTQSAQLRIRYLLPAGGPLQQEMTIAPNTRATIHVDAQPGLGATEPSGVIESLNGVPIIVERAMYSSAAGTFAAGHDSAGVTSPSLEWFFAEGATGSFFDTFLLMANPNGSAANVTATYLLPSGATVSRNYVLQPNSRTTLNVAEQNAQLAATAVSVRLASTNGVSFLAERSMWWPHSQPWTEAHNAAGATATGTKWGVADGEVGNLPEDTATFLLVANTAGVAASVRVTLLFETGAAVSQDFSVPASARLSVPVVTSEAPASAAYMRVPRGTRFSAVVESLGATPIVVERAMYWNANGQLWAAGSDLLATKLQ
jgi:Tol biopolymer transport system component